MIFDLSPVAEKLATVVSGEVATKRSLRDLTTYRLGGPAALFVEPHDAHDLERLGEALRSAGVGDVPVLVLGRGSNLVVSDHGFDGVVVHPGEGFSRIREWDPPQGQAGAGIAAGSATSLPQLANWAARRNLSGLEWAISIPGSVGGGVRMNAGAHGGEIADRLASAHIWNLDTLELEERPVGALGYSYRTSNLTDRDVVVEARFTMEPGDSSEIKGRMDEFRRHRAATQPGARQNAGSVFRNPLGDSAGRLVEAAGLKGFRVGGVSVSELHANFYIAEEGSKAQDVFDLVAEVKSRVAERFGVELEPEIRFVGRFEHREESA